DLRAGARDLRAHGGRAPVAQRARAPDAGLSRPAHRPASPPGGRIIRHGHALGRRGPRDRDHSGARRRPRRPGARPSLPADPARAGYYLEVWGAISGPPILSRLADRHAGERVLRQRDVLVADTAVKIELQAL